jgi:hypothetical protein
LADQLFSLSNPHCIIARSLLNFVDCFHLGIPKFLTKLDAVSLFQASRMQRTRVTSLHYLAVTDTSGSVARQQKITHAHESQFPQPFAITYRGKVYSRILFEQTVYNENVEKMCSVLNSFMMMCVCFLSSQSHLKLLQSKEVIRWALKHLKGEESLTPPLDVLMFWAI